VIVDSLIIEEVPENVFLSDEELVDRINEAIQEEKRLGGSDIDFPIDEFVTVAFKKEDGSWRTGKAQPGSMMTLKSARLGKKEIIFGFYCVTHDDNAFLCEVGLKNAERQISGFSNTMMMLLELPVSIGEGIRGRERVGDRLVKSTRINAEPEIKVDNPLFGTW